MTSSVIVSSQLTFPNYLFTNDKFNDKLLILCQYFPRHILAILITEGDFFIRLLAGICEDFSQVWRSSEDEL